MSIDASIDSLRKLAHAKYKDCFRNKEEEEKKKKKKKKKDNYYFSIYILAQNIHCGYTLEPLRRGDCNEYPQSMFWIKIRKIGIPPANPSLSIYSEV